MKQLLKFNLLISILLFSYSCSIGMQNTATNKAESKVLNRFQGKVNKVNSSKGIAAFGMGEAIDRNLAEDAARLNAQQKIAEAKEITIQGLKKMFTDQVTGVGIESSKHVSNAVKSIVNTDLIGAKVLEVQFFNTKLKGEKKKKYDGYRVYVLMEYDPKSVKKLFMQEIKVQNEEAYAQAKASKAYKELEETVNSYNE